MSGVDDIFDRAAKGKSLIKNRQTLNIDYIPERLPFRDEESNNLALKFSTIFRGARPSNLLLFGKPGTGKTAVVKTVVDKLIKKADALGIKITTPIINAKTANTAYKILYEIAKEMGTDDKGSKDRREEKIPFTGLSLGEANDRILRHIQKNGINMILVIDEIDSLVDKNGDVILYNFTRANQRMTKGGFISLVGISNSLTFKEKLDPRVRSSLSEEETVFNPYTIEQLRQILLTRAKMAFSEDAITDGVINLCAAMAGREHGDARKAIDLLRVSAELAEREHASTVEEKHVRVAQEKIEKDAQFLAIQKATPQDKLVMLAIAKSKNGLTGEVYDTYSSLCKKMDQEPLTQRRITQIISEMELLGVISTEVLSQGRAGRSQKIRITVPLSTVKEALRDDPAFAELIGY
jgi:cell division control protein 6